VCMALGCKLSGTKTGADRAIGGRKTRPQQSAQGPEERIRNVSRGRRGGPGLRRKFKFPPIPGSRDRRQFGPSAPVKASTRAIAGNSSSSSAACFPPQRPSRPPWAIERSATAMPRTVQPQRGSTKLRVALPTSAGQCGLIFNAPSIIPRTSPSPSSSLSGSQPLGRSRGPGLPLLLPKMLSVPAAQIA